MGWVLSQNGYGPLPISSPWGRLYKECGQNIPPEGAIPTVPRKTVGLRWLASWTRALQPLNRKLASPPWARKRTVPALLGAAAAVA